MSMRFTQKSKEHAIRIMQNISQHPCSKPFLFPLDPISSKCVDYYEKIKKPINITLIINRLLNAEDAYSYVDNWRSDFQLLYKNAITYFGRNSHVGNLAEALVQLFEKKYKCFLALYNTSLWLQRYSTLIQKIKMLEMTMPGSIGNSYRSLYASHVNLSPTLKLDLSDSITNEIEQVEQPQKSIGTSPISIQNQIENSEETKAKKGRPGRPRKTQKQDPTETDSELAEQPTKIKKPRKPRKPKEPKEKSDASPNNSINTDISKPNISLDSNQPIQTDSFPQPTIEKDPKPSIFPPSAYSLISGMPNSLASEEKESPTENKKLSKLPPQLEAKVEDMEDDVLYEVTSCFN